MKIIHTADWHIGQTFFGYDRFQEHQYFLDWLTDQITTQQIDVLLISGDIFDVANPSAQAQRQFYRFLRRVTEQNPGLQIILVNIPLVVVGPDTGTTRYRSVNADRSDRNSGMATIKLVTDFSFIRT